MSEVFVFIGFILFLATLPGTIELFFLSIGALLSKLTSQPIITAHNDSSFKIGVIIPAYNEEKHIRRTIESLIAAGFKDNIWVVADNCTDSTAEIAHEAGANVIKRDNLQLKGKNFALDFAFKSLALQEFYAYLIIDADSIVSTNLNAILQKYLQSGVEALQIHYGIHQTNLTPPKRFMNLTFEAFNHLRPLGRQYWNLSTGILGNGFLLCKRVIDLIPFKSESIVEDLDYHLKLVNAGIKVHYTDEAHVYAELPEKLEAMSSQRSRWEGGRLRVIFDRLPLEVRHFFQGNWALFEPILELTLLPLSYFVILLLPLLFMPSHFLRIYAVIAFSVIALHLAIAAVLARSSWKDILSLFLAPFYLIWKVGIIFKILRGSKKNSSWNRTER